MTTILQAARWLAVLAVVLFVSSGNVLALAPAVGKSACTESCAKRCPCCISKSAPVESSTPLAPTPSTRTTVAKDFQLISFCQALLLKDQGSDAIIPSHFSVAHFSVTLSVFLRHCSFLI